QRLQMAGQDRRRLGALSGAQEHRNGCRSRIDWSAMSSLRVPSRLFDACIVAAFFITTCVIQSPTASAATTQPADAAFPIGVWLQAPANVARYQAIGINHYI